MNCSLRGSSVHGIRQARIWSGLLFASPEELPNPGTEPKSPVLQADALLTELHGKPLKINYTPIIPKGRNLIFLNFIDNQLTQIDFFFL